MLRSLFTLFGGTPHKGWLSLSDRAANHLIGLSGVLTSGFIREHALFLIGAIGLCGYMGYLILKKKVHTEQLKELLFFISTPLLFFIFYLAYAYPIYSEYVVGLTIPILFAFSLMISLVWSFRPGKAIVVSLFVVSMFFLTTHLLAQYGASYIRDGSAGSYLNQKAAVDWVYADARNEPFGYFVYTPATYTYGMDYLFWYTATSRNQPLPKSEKQAIVYLIMYPPLQHDTQAHEFWKKNTIKTTGKIIAEKSFRGGIVVQKLSLSPDEEPPDSMYYQNLIFR